MNTSSLSRVQFFRVLCLLFAALLGLGGGRSLAQVIYTDQVAAGCYHTLVVKSDGTVWAWGLNDVGELGNNTLSGSYVPVQVSGLSGVMAVAAGFEHSLALKSDGTVWAWGENSLGQLGNNSTTGGGTPVQVSGLTNVVAIAGGGQYSMALKSDGTVWAWGDNSQGQLGNNSTTQSLVPVQVGSLANVVSMAAGYDFGVAVLGDGTMWSWGNNSFGQLGNNSTTRSLVPVQISGLTGMTDTSAGSDFAFGLKNDGTLWAWGDNGGGVLGINSTASRSLVPVEISSPTNFSAVVSGSSGAHTLAMTADTELWSWGTNNAGQLGGVAGFSQVAPQGINWGMVAAAVGNRHSVAITSSGNIMGWGYDMEGELGNDRSYSLATPVQIAWFNGVVAVSVGGEHSLAATSDGSVYAWGDNESGQLGDGTGNPRATPYPVPTYWSSPVVAVSAGELHSLVLTKDGNVFGWGDNNDGELGQGNYTGVELSPLQVNGLTNITAIAASYFSSVALKNDGTVYTFGANWNGQLGNNTTANSNVPILVSGLTGITSISASAVGLHVLALKNDGTVWAWGYNSNGQLGNNSTTDSHVPVQVSGLSGIVAVTAGGVQSYGLKSDGTVWAWGDNTYGELGNNSTVESHVPIQVPGLTGVVKIIAGGSHAVALKSDGSVWSWGVNWSGQLGNGTTNDSWVPVQISSLAGIKAIAVGDASNVALKEDGTLTSWGDCTFGNLGIGWGYAHADARQVFGLNLLHPAPQAAFTSPAPGGSVTVPLGQNTTLGYTTTPSDTSVFQVQLWTQGVNIDSNYDYGTYYWWPTTYGDFNVSLVAVDENGVLSLPSAPITIHVPWDSDGNGLPDWWELKYFFHLGNVASSLAPSGNGLTILQCYQQGVDPFDYYKGLAPIVTAVGPTLASTPMNTNIPQPFTAQVTDQLGNPLANAPVSIYFAQGSGQMSSSGAALSWSNTLSFRTDANGKATFYVGAYYSNIGLNKVGVTAGTVIPATVYFDMVATRPYNVGVSDYYSLAIEQNQTVWEWGNTDLGIWGFQEDNVTPAQVPGLSNVISTASGRWTEIAVDQNEHAWIWGNLSPGDTSGGTYSPIQMSGLPGVVAGAAGEMHFLALANDGTVWAWGANDNGQLGNSTTDDSTTPIQAVGLTGIFAVAAGSYHSLAVKDDGTLWAWGMNSSGQLGIGSNVDSVTPTQVSGLTWVQAVSAGTYHSAAIDSEGNLWTWGGYGPNTPTQVPGLYSVTAISAGNYNTLAVTSDGSVWDVSTNPAVPPVQVSGLANIAMVATGSTHSLAVTNSGAILAWGDNTSGELGSNVTNDGSLPVLATRPAQLRYLNNASMATGGDSFAVALRSDGTVWGWGDNSNVQLGTYTGTAAAEPVPIPTISDVASLSSNGASTVAVKTDGTVWGWGQDTNSAFYNSTPGYPYYAYIYSASPVQLSGMTGAVAAASMASHGVALKNDGTVWTWGSNYYGEAGTGATTGYYLAPVQVFGITTAKAIAIGATYCMALKSDGTVWAWGGGAQGLLGNNSTANQRSPVQVSGLTNVVAIAASNRPIALKSDGTVWAWGPNPLGEVGDGTTTERDVPVQVSGLTNVVGVAAGVDHSLALKADGTVWAWGSNTDSQLGDGTTNNSLVPIQVAGMEGIKSIGAGASNSYAVKQDGTVVAWGDSTYGQAGSGLIQNQPAILPVLGINLIGTSPSVTFSTPPPTVALGSNAFLQFTTTLPNGPIGKVQLLLNGEILNTNVPNDGSSIFWRPTTYGDFELTLVLADQTGAYSARSAPIQIHVPYDSDGNGLPDWWELQYFGYVGVDPTSQPDGSGLTVAQMFAQGTYPLDPNYVPPVGGDPTDTTPLVITLTKPAGATLVP